MRDRDRFVLLAGAGFLLTGLAVGSPSRGTIGADYEMRGYAKQTREFVMTERVALGSPRDGNLWMGAGLALLGVVASGVVADRS